MFPRKGHSVLPNLIFSFLVISTLITSILGNANSGQAQTTSSISGKVVDHRTRQPLPGTNVFIKDTAMGTATGPDGSYLISNIPPGTYTLVASFIGYHTEETQVIVRDSSNTGSISGKIIDDKTGKPIAGITVSIRGTSISTTTESDGSYTIANLPPGDYTLEVSTAGYQSLETSVTVDANKVDFSLREDVLRGEAVVVTGIASRTSKSVAEVAVSRIPAGDYTLRNTYRTVSQLINGKLSGVQVKRTSGNVGSGFRFNMRSGGGLNGDEQPEIYVDGVRVENAEVLGFEVGGQGLSLLADLNPEEIENIEILKGPAGAASYGTSGSNGVVLITTKRGKYSPGVSKAVSIDYKIVTGWNTQSYNYSKDDYLSADDANAIFRTGNIIQNSLSASGGTEVVRYFTAFDSRVEEGILSTNRLDRKNIRANFDVIPNDRLTFRVTSSYTYSEVERPANDNNLFGFLINTTIRPTSYDFVGGGRSAVENILDENVSNRFIGSLQADYAPFKNFSGRVTLGIDDHDLRQDQTYPVNETYSDPLFDDGLRNIFTRRSRLLTYVLDGQFKFSPRPDLNVLTIAGMQLFDRRVNTFFNQKFDFPTDLLTNIDAGIELSEAGESFSHRREAGIFGEVNLSYLEQYYLTARLRRDYASVIGKNAPSIFYPGVSFSVRMDKYEWFPQSFNLWKLRAAYGETGVLPNLLDGIPIQFIAEPGGAGVGGVIGQLGNGDIKPERVKELEIGFDTEFLNNYAVEFTYYRQKAIDSIVGFLNSPSTGLIATPVPFNIGEIKGWGFETLFQASIFRIKDFSLDITLINNWQENKVEDLGGAQPIFDAFNVQVIKEGLSKHEFYVVPVLGADFNEDGTYAGPIVGEERSAHGNPIPTYNGSMSLNLRLFKNLNLYLLADWATGHKIWNGSNTEVFDAGNNPRFNTLATQLGIAGTAEVFGVAINVEPVEGVDRFTPGTPEYIAAAEEFAKMDPFYDANFIEDADFIKLRELSISYRFKDILPKIFGATRYLKDFTVAFSATNLLTFTKYSGPEVEVNWSGSRELERGQDFFTLQNPRTYNISFRFSL